ncbi:MAG: hypothetical protein KME11_00345 [Timaviella obliquedivisa GSE-PSE-MK23-08B]|nr:hypothetical protein [Timaviella obliquedivisa GSE-PSE-MK23-08B]
MSLNIFSSSYPGLQLFVKHRLHESINIQAQNQHLDLPRNLVLESIRSAQSRIVLAREIPVKLAINQTQISYVSAIAFLLEKSWGQPATEIAQKLTESLLQASNLRNFEELPSPLRSVWKSFSFDTNSTGWITLKLSDQGLAKWLEILIYFFQNLKDSSYEINNWDETSRIHLRDSTVTLSPLSGITYNKDLFRNSTDVLLAQHAHARCCSLLRMGMQQGLIQLAAFPRGQSIVEPVPWLGEAALLRCHHSSEHQLIRQICQNLDEISLISSFSDPQRTLKQLSKLSQAFHRFYADCLIFNKVEVNNLALAQVRLGIVDLVRSLLHLLLEDGLGILAPPEL